MWIEDKLKWIPKDSIPTYIEIYNILKANKTISLTSHEIFERMDEKIREWQTPAKITQKLEILKKRQIIQKTNRKITYIMDLKNNEPLYWWNIWQKFIEYLTEILKESINDDKILKIILDTLEASIKDSDNSEDVKNELIQTVSQIKNSKETIFDVTNYIISSIWDPNKEIFKLYECLFNKIVEKNLYDNSKSYWELKRQNTANKYKIIEN